MGADGQEPHAKAISADELRTLMATRPEGEYLLIDVREPEEYQLGHLPGARSMPLSEVDDAPPISDLAAHTVLYCHTGVRSKRAADALARKLASKGVYALDGGLDAWRGRTVQDFPNVLVFDGAGSLEDLLLRAMDLEKGAHRLYEALCTHFQGSRIRPVIEELLRAEVGHGRSLYKVLEQCSTRELEPFETLFANLTGDVVENGAYLDEMLLVAGEVGRDDEPALLELALGVEYMAYDLYRNLADRVRDQKHREVFVALAAQEKGHAQHVLRALGRLASDSETDARLR